MDKETILEYLTNHKKELKEKYQLEKIGLFGSYAKDESTFGSDIDLVLKFNNSYISSCDPWDYFDKLNDLKQTIKDNFFVEVDIVDEQSDSPYISTIKNEAIYV